MSLQCKSAMIHVGKCLFVEWIHDNRSRIHPQTTFASEVHIIFYNCKYFPGIEFIYLESVRSTKYLSIAFVISVIGFGGLSEVLSISIITIFISKTHGSDSIRLDFALYGLSGLALIALLVSIYLMHTFHRYFQPVIRKSFFFQSLELSDDKITSGIR